MSFLHILAVVDSMNQSKMKESGEGKREEKKMRNTHGKNLKAFTSKLFFVNDSRMSSSDTVVLRMKQKKNE